jgi:acyl-CoA synthetase (AMP-forming)/AMP-acid ligase II
MAVLTAESVRLESDALHARVRAMIGAFEGGRAMPESFDTLAADLARFQAQHVPGYGRLCTARGVDPRAIARASEAPAVPAEAFKLARVFAFDERDAAFTFRTSGTSGATVRGAHAMRTAASYDAAALAFGAAMFARGLERRVPVVVIGPSDAEAPDSSLSHMCALFARAFGMPDGVRTFFVRSGALDVDALRERFASLSRDVPALVLATSFGLVHWLDAIGSAVVPLPPGSRVMQTGGYKGRSREVSAVDLRRAVAQAFAIDERAVVAEYGMTELSSQFWEATLVDPGAKHGQYAEPPWARVAVVDPETLSPVSDGEVGIARIEDLANVDSAFAILTQDRVRRVGERFELLGRAPGAPPRGCSIALDEMLSAEADEASA